MKSHCACLTHGTPWHAQLERFLAGLDRQHSYYSVSHIAGLIKAEKIDIPCDLKLTLFIAEGEQDVNHAPHVRVVPIPLLGSVRMLLRPESSGRLTMYGSRAAWPK